MRMVIAGWMVQLRSRALRRVHRRMKARRAALEAGQENPALQAVQQEVHHQAQTAQQQKIALQIPQTARQWFISLQPARNITVRAVGP